MLRGPFNQVSIFNTIMSATISAERVFEFLDSEDRRLGDDSMMPLPKENEFDKVNFGYTENLL